MTDTDTIARRLGFSTRTEGGGLAKSAEAVWEQMKRMFDRGESIPSIANKVGKKPWEVAKVFHEHGIWPTYLTSD